jgi:Tat protein translocase TatC
LALVLFAAGVGFGYQVMVPYACFFFVDLMDPTQVQPIWSVSEYFSFLFSLTLALGLVFQLPLVMMVLVAVGVVEPSFYIKYWRHTIVGIFALAAIITPPDPYTQSFMAIPMCLLFLLGLGLAKIAHRRRLRIDKGLAT